MPEETETNWVAILGGSRFKVRKMDGSTEEVVVRAINLEKAKDVLNALADPILAVEKFTGKKAAWTNELDPNSVFDLIDEGVRLNTPFFTVYKGRMESLGKGLQGLLGVPQGA